MKVFNKNVGHADKAVRIVIGAGLLSIAFWGPQTPWGFLGLIPLATAMIGFCPLYTVFGFKTCPANK